MNQTLFISDLHLCEERPQITALFLDFLATTAKHAETLYVLGDLFEYWAGDDDLSDPYHQIIVAGLRALSKNGTRLYIMHGNRDLLIGQDFMQACGANPLPDPTVIDLYGQTVLLAHGDKLCTDDVKYQEFRRQVHDPAWQKIFLAQPLTSRKAQISGMRQQSEQEKSHKSEAIMDVNTEAVARLFGDYNFPPLLIHGHTHRMNRHALNISGHQCERIVLGDWYESGSYLECSMQGCAMQVITAT
ncbi:MAG: UDP-2,3-diacylglucosamine diphosphatase [Methylophilales bacterium]|nr:UDP-2,3-diacylglucosamine diphosphatase [Methylophilales bacterium]